MKSRRRNLVLLLTVPVVIAAVIWTFALLNQRAVPASEFILREGVPLLVAAGCSETQWDPDSKAVIRARKLVVTGVREWDEFRDPQPRTTMVFSDNPFDQAYWQMVWEGKLTARTFAIGERAHILCADIDENGQVIRTRRFAVPFVQFRNPELPPL